MTHRAYRDERHKESQGYRQDQAGRDARNEQGSPVTAGPDDTLNVVPAVGTQGSAALHPLEGCCVRHLGGHMHTHPLGLLEHPEGQMGQGGVSSGLTPAPHAQMHLEGAGEKQEEGEK